MNTVWIIDDDKSIRWVLEKALEQANIPCRVFESAETIMGLLEKEKPAAIMTDIRMPGMDGLGLLKKLMSSDSALPVMMITGHGDVPMAVEAMRLGAFDFLEKPFDPDNMTAIVRKATVARRLTLDNRALRRELSDGGQLMQKLAGNSPAMRQLREDILDLGQADGHVLIDGETGTGKTLAAHALHAAGARAGKTFSLISCSAVEQETLIGRLFGPMQPDESQLPAVEAARGGF